MHIHVHMLSQSVSVLCLLNETGPRTDCSYKSTIYTVSRAKLLAFHKSLHNYGKVILLAWLDGNNPQQQTKLESLICVMNAAVYPWCISGWCNVFVFCFIIAQPSRLLTLWSFCSALIYGGVRVWEPLEHIIKVYCQHVSGEERQGFYSNSNEWVDCSDELMPAHYSIWSFGTGVSWMPGSTGCMRQTDAALNKSYEHENVTHSRCRCSLYTSLNICVCVCLYICASPCGSESFGVFVEGPEDACCLATAFTQPRAPCRCARACTCAEMHSWSRLQQYHEISIFPEFCCDRLKCNKALQHVVCTSAQVGTVNVNVDIILANGLIVILVYFIALISL